MQFCHTLREFALEYRTCRERVLQQQQKRATYRERNKTRGRMITEVDALPGVARKPCDCLSSAQLTRLPSPDREVLRRGWGRTQPPICPSGRGQRAWPR